VPASWLAIGTNLLEVSAHPQPRSPVPGKKCWFRQVEWINFAGYSAFVTFCRDEVGKSQPVSRR
jgi:hypothetical protein